VFSILGEGLNVNVHACSFFTVFCFPAAGLGPLATERDLTAERGRRHLCHSSCPWLLPPAAATSTHAGAAARLSRWARELLASQGLCGPPERRRQAPAAGTNTPVCCWVTVRMLGSSGASGLLCTGPRVQALAFRPQAGDAANPGAGEWSKTSLSSGMCLCFPSGLTSCVHGPPELALPLAKVLCNSRALSVADGV